MKASTRQRFAALNFDYPDAELEARIVATEADVERSIADALVAVAHRSRALKNKGLDEGVSTRMLIYAAQLIASGVTPQESCAMTMTDALTDEPQVAMALQGFIAAQFGSATQAVDEAMARCA
jgi:nitric oxide reductase NorQ protein